MRLLIIILVSVIFMFFHSTTSLNLELHKQILMKSFYEVRQSLNTSILGNVLFKNQNVRISPLKRRRQFKILIWDHLNFLPHMHIFGTQSLETIQACSVTNCEFTGDNNALSTADAVVVHILHAKWPQVTQRNPKQKWIFFTEESPQYALPVGYELMQNVFNWSMTYKTDSDVPVPYGRTVPLAAPWFAFEDIALSKLAPFWNEKQKDVPVAILTSHCVPYRMNFIARLKKYIKVDVYGKCGHKLRHACPDNFKNKVDCNVLSKYIFYLALEDSICREYITEKVFFNGYYHGAIPIIQGPSLEDCKRLLPPHSYIHVDSYTTIKELAKDLIRISKDTGEIFNYHWWRNHFRIVNEHGFFGSNSFYLCRVCEALNYNTDKEYVYDKNALARFLDKQSLCKTV